MVVETSRLLLIPLPAGFYECSLAGNRTAAENMLNAAVPDDWFAERWLQELRLNDLRRDPALGPWLLRAMISCDQRRMIGHIGFHDRPGAAHLAEIAPLGVEVGYTVFAADRRQGFAREALVGLLQWAEQEQNVHEFVASVSPENLPSLSLVRQMGFQRVGSHFDEIDGPEDIYLKVGAPA